MNFDPNLLPPDMKEWYLSRSSNVQFLVQKFPPGKYRVKYPIPGTSFVEGIVVELSHYHELGFVGVILEREFLEQDPSKCYLVNPNDLDMIEMDSGWRRAWGLWVGEA